MPLSDLTCTIDTTGKPKIPSDPILVKNRPGVVCSKGARGRCKSESEMILMGYD